MKVVCVFLFTINLSLLLTPLLLKKYTSRTVAVALECVSIDMHLGFYLQPNLGVVYDTARSTSVFLVHCLKFFTEKEVCF